MRILCVIDSLGSGGAQRQLVNLAVGFKEYGHEISFLVYHRINFFSEILNNHRIEIIEVIEPNYFLRVAKIRQFIRKSKFDSVLSFLETPNFICELAGFPSRNWKLVVGERSANPKILKSFKLRFLRLFHIFADYVVVNSQENSKIVRKANPFLSARKCLVIYNIVDLERSDSIEGYNFRRDGKFHLLVAASHQYLKNLNGLVEAVNLLDDSEKRCLSIEWYGGPSLDDSKDIAQIKIDRLRLNNIFNFNEPTDLIIEKMREADAVGLFSFYEGLPNVVCEAMALGKPVISSSVSDIPVLIKDNHLLFNPNSPTEIQGVLKYILNISSNELEKIGNVNKIIGQNLFNKKSIINAYLKILT